jgi:G3E family GTPase
LIGDLTKILSELVDGRFGNIVRAKGQLWADGAWIDFSLVTGTVGISTPRLAASKEQAQATNSFGQIVVIAEALDKNALQDLLRFPGPETCRRV